MFGIDFAGFDDGGGLAIRRCCCPTASRAPPLRKSFQLAARASKPWPGAKARRGPASVDRRAAAVCRHRVSPGVGPR